jgi:hypothetical protein
MTANKTIRAVYHEFHLGIRSKRLSSGNSFNNGYGKGINMIYHRGTVVLVTNVGASEKYESSCRETHEKSSEGNKLHLPPLFLVFRRGSGPLSFFKEETHYEQSNNNHQENA